MNVRGLSGDAELRTGSGDVNAEHLATADVTADTASGDVELELPARRRAASTRRPRPATWTSLVPEGEAYRVEADSGSGEQALDVKTDPASTRIIRAQTSSGDVTVAYGN